MPLKRIGDWAGANSIPMDKLYATEQREGGTPALDTDVTGFQREDLSVFTAEEWERRKDRFVIEKWVDAARAADSR